ncbi:unnamed protein product [Dovyalis caffra]|uniref:CASP-like protein n=1 Tax=Dovyalis caffra TaxID=77055 RepID=A0AAV1SXZ6_9ROSI|nr:unnamed protein product [Dovyalis caffra]
MALQNEEKLEVGYSNVQPKQKRWVLLMLRVVAFLATAAATVVMGLNKETKTLVVATIGSTPITATLTAKFQHTPAFVFFVVANGMASNHNLVMIMVELCGQKLDYKGLRLAMIAILDMMTVSLLSGGVNAAAFMSELGKNGNSHARWNKICDKFETFCDRGGGALIASFAGLILMLIISVMSIIKLLIKPKPDSSFVNVAFGPSLSSGIVTMAREMLSMKYSLRVGRYLILQLKDIHAFVLPKRAGFRVLMHFPIFHAPKSMGFGKMELEISLIMGAVNELGLVWCYGLDFLGFGLSLRGLKDSSEMS